MFLEAITAEMEMVTPPPPPLHQDPQPAPIRATSSLSLCLRSNLDKPSAKHVFILNLISSILPLESLRLSEKLKTQRFLGVYPRGSAEIDELAPSD